MAQQRILQCCTQTTGDGDDRRFLVDVGYANNNTSPLSNASRLPANGEVAWNPQAASAVT